MHLSTIFYTKSSYCQGLPEGMEGWLAMCGCFPMRKYISMVFKKSYPVVPAELIKSKTQEDSKFAGFCVEVCNVITMFFAYMFKSAVIDIEEFMVDLELIAPNSDEISFSDLAEKACCCETQTHPDVLTPAILMLDRIDRFMSLFNGVHSVFRRPVSIPQRASAKYRVFEGSQPDAYQTMPFHSKEGGKGGSRTIGINPYMLGFSSGESVIDVADTSKKVSCKAWCQVICSLGLLYLPLVKFVLDSKTVLITTSRRIIKVELMSPAPNRVLEPTMKYTRHVESFFEPCKPHAFAILFFLTCLLQTPPNPQNFAKLKSKAVSDAALASPTLR